MVLIQNSNKTDSKFFYLISSDGSIFSDCVREVKIIKRMSVGDRDDFALISITPSCFLFDQKKFVNLELKEFLIGSRHKDFSIFGKEFPVEVYVCTFKHNNISDIKNIDANDLNILAWATLCDKNP